MNVPLKNYKYRTREAALLDILEGAVYFAKPSEFHESNDQLEGEFVMGTTSQSFLESIIEGLNTIKEKKNEPPIVLPKFQFSPSTDKLISMSNNDFIEQANELGIYSTSSSYDNQAMWTHYCKNQGVCFELEWDQKIIDRFHFLIKNVEYSSKVRKVNRDVVFKNMLIEYGTKHSELSIEELLKYSMSKEFRSNWMQNFILECSCIKQECWSYENEIRLLSPQAQVYPILKEILRSVYMFIPQFKNPNFKAEISKSRQLKLIWAQLAEHYSDVKLFGLSYDKTGQLNMEQIRLRKYIK